MTSPVAYDHPDYQRTTANTGIRVFGNNVVVGAATVGHGRFLVGTSPYVHLLYNVNAGGARLTLTWYGSAAGADLIATNTVDVRAGQFADGGFPCLGPFLELSSIADAANRTVTLQVWQANSGGNGVPLSFPDNLIVVDTQVLAGGGTRTDNASAVLWGWGHWFALMEAAVTWASTLYAVDYQNNQCLLDLKGLGVAAGGSLFLLPPQPIRVITRNFDAGAHNVNVSVNHHVGPL
jgi:hypothetical protein